MKQYIEAKVGEFSNGTSDRGKLSKITESIWKPVFGQLSNPTPFDTHIHIYVYIDMYICIYTYTQV